MHRSTDRWLSLTLALLTSASVLCQERVYKSVDASGHVTYSTEPSVDAVEMQVVPVHPGPPAAEIEQALGEARHTEQQANASFDALMALRREKEAAAERRRLADEAAERERRLHESLERLEQQPPVYFYPGPWYGHRPGYPGHRPRPPRPEHPQAPPPRPEPFAATPVRPSPPRYR